MVFGRNNSGEVSMVLSTSAPSEFGKVENVNNQVAMGSKASCDLENDTGFRKFDSDDAVQVDFFPVENGVVKGLLGLLLTALPFSMMLMCIVLFQGITLLIVSAIYVLFVPLVAWRIRAVSSKPMKRFMSLYLVGCSVFLIIILVDFMRPVWGRNMDKDIVIMGGLTSNSLKMNVFSNERASYTVELRSIAPVVSNWTDIGVSTPLLEEAQFVGLTEITGLTANTKYEYAIKFNNGEIEGPSGSFKTLPTSSTTDKIVFASSSCSQRDRQIGGIPLDVYERITKVTDGELAFFSHGGDFIYTDVPWGLGYAGGGFGTDEVLYGNEYRSTLTDPYVMEFMRNTPFTFMMDDHELSNDYALGNETEVFQTAMKMWNQYIGAVNPVDYQGRVGGFYYTMDIGRAKAFVFDTLYNRNHDLGTIIGEEQLDAAKQYLLDAQAANATFKFLFSPIQLTRNHFENNGWSCACPKCETLSVSNAARCPNERERLLSFIADNGITNVVFITGDTHKPGLWELQPGVMEVSASPLNALSPPLFENEIDKTLYEETGILSVFAVYELEDEKLTVKYYGGGPSAGHFMMLTIFITLAFVYFPTVIFFRRNQMNNMLFTDVRIIVVLSLLIIGGIVSGVFLTRTYDSSFEQPRFVHEFEFKL